MATKTEKKTGALDAGTSNESNELSAIAVKSLTNLEEKVEAIDWKLCTSSFTTTGICSRHCK